MAAGPAGDVDSEVKADAGAVPARPCGSRSAGGQAGGQMRKSCWGGGRQTASPLRALVLPHLTRQGGLVTGLRHPRVCAWRLRRPHAMSVRVVAFQRPQTHRLSYSQHPPQRLPSSRPTPTPATTPTGSIKCGEAVIGGPASTGHFDPRIMNCSQGGGEGATLAAGRGPLPPLCLPARLPLIGGVRSMQSFQQRRCGRCPLPPPQHTLLLRVCLCRGRATGWPCGPGGGAAWGCSRELATRCGVPGALGTAGTGAAAGL